MNENTSTAPNGEQSNGEASLVANERGQTTSFTRNSSERSEQIKICDERITDAVFQIGEMLELHQKYGNQERTFYLSKVEQQCSMLQSWLDQRGQLVQWEQRTKRAHSKDVLPALIEDLSCGGHADEIKLCDDAVRNAMTLANKMLELHEKYDTAANSFYLHRVNNHCAEIDGWVERRRKLITDAASKGWLKADMIQFVS